MFILICIRVYQSLTINKETVSRLFSFYSVLLQNNIAPFCHIFSFIINRYMEEVFSKWPYRLALFISETLVRIYFLNTETASLGHFIIKNKLKIKIL